MDLNPIYRALADGGAWPSIDERAADSLREDGADLLVAGTLQQIAAGSWPATDRATLARRQKDAAVRELLETNLLTKTLCGLQNAGASCLLLKGVAIARTHYPMSWWRLRRDIDLLVPADALKRAESALNAAGWRAAVEPTAAVVSGQRHFSHAVPGAPPLDLHVRLLAPFLERSPSFPELWHARRAVPGMAVQAWTLSDADALWYGCVHLALHHTGEASILWLFDLDRLSRGLDDAGWAAVDARAGATRTRALCATLLHLAADRFGTPLPEQVCGWRALGREPSERFLAARSELRIQWLNFQAAGGWRARAAWIRAHVLPDAAYIRARYGVRSRAGVAGAYTHRAVWGALRWIADAIAGQR